MDDGTNTVLDTVGPRLRAVRRDREVTLAELAEATGISVSTLSRLENGARKPTLDEMGPGTESRIYQPKSSREAGPEFGPSPRSTGGAPGKRGGWKRR